MYSVERKTIAALSADMAAGRVTAEALCDAYRRRIAAIDHAGPLLRSVLALNPLAGAGGGAGRLAGIPILVKDNIETADPMPTTAGSLALARNVTGRDALVIARLRAEGAVILGKTNLSEWANMRGSRSISGWSALGGQTRNPYALDRSPCGSSSGSGVAVAASLCAAAIGTETDGSITCPAGVAGIVGLKPTRGLLPRTHIIPLAHSQDTPGPMAATVADAALLLTIMAGSDPSDPDTADADRHATDYSAGLDRHRLAGRRLGVMRYLTGYHPELDLAFEHALDLLRRAGAELIDVKPIADRDAIEHAELQVLLTELKADLNAYLATAAAPASERTLAGLIAFNRAHADRELGLFGQELFEKADATLGLHDPGYLDALRRSREMAGPEGIDRMLAETGADALLAPTNGPAWTIDSVNGDHYMGSASALPAVAGYPHLTVPMGMIAGMPVGLSLIGPAWSDARVLGLGHGFERLAGRPPAPDFPASLDIAAPRAALTRPPAA